MEREPTDLQDTALRVITPDVTGNRENTGAPPIETIQRSPPRARAESDDSTVTEDSTFNPRQLDTTTEDEALATYMMFSPRGTTELPTLRTDTWPYEGHKPNPINISKARKLLAAAYAAIPCEITAAGVHGHAWIIETDAEWKKRTDVTHTVVTPTKPIKETDYDVRKQLEYADKMEMYKLYNHLMQAGKLRLITWFGKSMFDDLHVDGLLPTTITPSELLEHLSLTYSQGFDHRRHMEQVEKEFNAPYDPKKPVETYFMKLQEARSNAALLGQPYTDEQAMNKALKQFEKQYEKEARKTEKRWNKKPADDRTWATFKSYWKDEIHQWETLMGAGRQANQAVMEQVDTLSQRMTNMQINMDALHSENQSYKDENSALLAEQTQIHRALQAEQRRRHGGDDISTITEHVDRRIDTLTSQIAGLTASSTSTSTGYGGGQRKEQLLEQARHRAPNSYKNLNDGRGKKFTKYCWNCGCNTTHWTRRCYALTDDQKNRYREASFDNTMGGSTKFLDRRDRYQKDYDFDSL